MTRHCTHCGRPFGRHDFVKETSRGMEHERRALGLDGVRFLYYRCPGCGRADIFVDLRPLAGEDAGSFRARRQALEAAVREAHAEAVEVVLTAR